MTAIASLSSRVRVPASPPYEELLVPDVAIGTEQARRLVTVVNAENVVTPKYVTLGQVLPDGLRVIKENGGVSLVQRPETAAQLRGHSDQLAQALRAAALLPGEIAISDGAPAQAAAVRAGHFLDRAS